MSAPFDVPSTFAALRNNATDDKCLVVNRTFLQLPLKIWQLFKWMFTDEDISDAFRQQLWPAGTIIESARLTPPPGNWLECNGQAVSRSIDDGGLVDTYKDLWEALGTTYGEGDETTTFNVPDKRGRAGIGAGQLEDEEGDPGDTYTQGDKSGKEGVVLLMENLPASPAPVGAKADALLVHKTDDVSDDNTPEFGAITTHNVRVRTNAHEDHNDNALGDLGDDEPHENRSPSVVMRFFIAY